MLRKLLFALLALASSAPAQTPHVFFHITLASSAPAPVSGRLLIFLKQGSGDKEVSVDEFHPTSTWVAAREVHDLAPGASVDLEATTLAFPASFASAPAGDWEAQAILDPTHSYNYLGRQPTDWMSPVLALPHWSPAAPTPALTLTTHPPDEQRPITDALLTANHIQRVEFESPVLTRFWGSPTFIRSWVVLPPGYEEHPADHYPTVYFTSGFGGSFTRNIGPATLFRRRMEQGKMPPMIWVVLDESCPQGTHEFADSVNDGPWGTALTTEFLPMLESRFRMDGRPTGRFLNGHSSGGWATLQLQVNYPQIFGGTWSTSPDPSDFHNFTGPNLYAPNANVYTQPSGAAWPIMRDHGQVQATLQQFSQLEEVLGPYGGQMRSFDWVFSPRAPDGSPAYMFDRQTGAVDPTVVAYWRDHFDLAHIVEATWPQRGPMLKGRIHLFVGTADTFYLDGSAHLFEARLQALGADPHFTYIPDRTHFDLYKIADDRFALYDRIAAEMYAVARPNSTLKPVP